MHENTPTLSSPPPLAFHRFTNATYLVHSDDRQLFCR